MITPKAIQGSAIRIARQSRGIDLKDAAREFQMTAKKWNRIEEDNHPCPLNLLPAMSKFFHYQLEFFFEAFTAIHVLGCRGCCGSLAPGAKAFDLIDIKNALEKFAVEHPNSNHEFSLIPQIRDLVEKELGKIP